jgi:hypothetical protein
MNLIGLSTALPRLPGRGKPDARRPPRGLWQALPVSAALPDPQYALRQLLEAVEGLAGQGEGGTPPQEGQGGGKEGRASREAFQNPQGAPGADPESNAAPALPLADPELASMAAKALALAIKSLCPQAVDAALDTHRLILSTPELDEKA